MATNDPKTLALQHAIQQSKSARAQSEPPEVKIVEGARLWDMARAWSISAIASQNPEWSSQQVQAEFRRRMKLVRAKDERGIYQVIGKIE
jgi:hypothetical protein